MKVYLYVLVVLVSLMIISCDTSKEISITVKNNTHLLLEDALIEIPVADLKAKSVDFNEKAVQVSHNDKEIPYQLDDRDLDGQPDMLVLVMDLQPDEEAKITVITSQNVEIKQLFTKRTQAEVSHKVGGKFADKIYIGGDFKNVSFVRVPDEHTDHDTYFRYEGPGWESDRVGYRFYLDWRNATDIFGKKTTDMVLQNVGQDGFDSYHEMADWGVDVLKVGSTLGLGSIGTWQDDKVYMVSKTDSITCAIIANGPVFSLIETSYYGWVAGDGKYDLLSQLSIAAGDRKTRHDIELRGEAANICTGLVKHDKARLMESDADGEWQYLATYGAQSLAGDDDQLGMAVLYKKSDLIERVDDGQSHIVVLKPEEGKLKYYFLAAWEQEPEGIKDFAQFREYLEREILKLNKPISLTQ